MGLGDLLEVENALGVKRPYPKKESTVMNERLRDCAPGDRLPANPSRSSAEALAGVLKELADLSPDDRKRVLHAASAFYRVEK